MPMDNHSKPRYPRDANKKAMKSIDKRIGLISIYKLRFFFMILLINMTVSDTIYD